MKKAIKRLLKKFPERKYHSRHRRSALKVLKSIESVKGKTDRNLIKRCDEYAKDVFGWKGYAPWLYVYSAINGEFREGWIPDNFYGKIVVPQRKGNYGKISDYSALTSRIFNSSLFPDRAYCVNGMWLSPENGVLSDEEVLSHAFRDTEKVVYKIDNSRQGKGVHLFDKTNFDVKKMERLGNGVLQKYIRQHPFFDEIMPDSVATLRLTSVVDDAGKVSVRACYLRVGRKSDTHVKSSSHIRIPVDLSTGLLGEFGYTTDWINIERHPDTEFNFENKQVPHLEKCIEAVKALHEKVLFTRSIGWDLILDSDGQVQIMEWNGGHNDIKFSEATQGPCFSDLGWEKLTGFHG